MFAGNKTTRELITLCCSTVIGDSCLFKRHAVELSVTNNHTDAVRTFYKKFFYLCFYVIENREVQEALLYLEDPVQTSKDGLTDQRGKSLVG